MSRFESVPNIWNAANVLLLSKGGDPLELYNYHHMSKHSVLAP